MTLGTVAVGRGRQGLTRDEDRPLAAGTERPEVVAAGHELDDEPGPLGELAQLVGRDEAQPVAPDPASRRPALAALLEDRGQGHRRGRRVVEGRPGLGHDRAGLRVEARPLEHDPAVEPGQVLRVRQPDVDDRETARREVVGERPEGGLLGGPGRQHEQRVERDEREAEPAGVGQPQADEVGLDERQPVRAGGAGARVAGPGRASPGRGRHPVTRWPASTSGIARRPVPTASSRIGPSARSASAR